MRVRLRSRMAGPEGCFEPGQVVDVSEENARALLSRQYAERLTPSADEIIQYTPWPQDGCSLDEALRRTAEPSLWTAAIEAENKLNAAGGRKGRRVAYVLDIERQSWRMPSEEQDRRRLQLAADHAMHEVTSRFYSLLAEGSLVAIGSDGRPTQLPSLIPSPAWQYLKIRSWAKSIVAERTKDKREWYGVRVFPALLAPNVGSLIESLTVSDVFNKFVVSDPEVRALATLALRTDHFAKPILEEGKLRRHWNFVHLWPVDLQRLESLAGHLRANMSYWEPTVVVSAECEAAFVALRSRYQRLLELCRLVGVRGTVVSAGVAVDIDAVQFARPSAWLDVRKGDLLDEDGNGNLVARWLGLSFHVKPTAHAGAAAFATEQKTVKGKTPVDPGEHSEAQHSPRPHRRRSAQRDSIAEAVNAIWPNGIPKGTLNKARDRNIIDWQRSHRIAAVSTKTINRYFADQDRR